MDWTSDDARPAYHRTILEARKKSPALDAPLDEAVDVTLPKSDPAEQTRVIREQLAELSRAQARQTPTD